MPHTHAKSFCPSCRTPLSVGEVCYHCHLVQKAKKKLQRTSKHHANSTPLEKCPRCRQKSLVRENGCCYCQNPQCQYSVCEA